MVVWALDASYPFPLFTAADLRAMTRQAQLQRNQIALATDYSMHAVDRFLAGKALMPDAAAVRFLDLYMLCMRDDAQTWPLAS